jgi:hypothetical protein
MSGTSTTAQLDGPTETGLASTDGGSTSLTSTSTSFGMPNDPLSCTPYLPTCCPELPSPCGEVIRASLGDGTTPQLDFSWGAVHTDSFEDARCMITLLKEGETPFRVSEWTHYTVAGNRRVWVVDPNAMSVILVAFDQLDFGADTGFSVCEYTPQAIDDTCTVSRDPSMLGACIDSAFSNCQPDSGSGLTCPT